MCVCYVKRSFFVCMICEEVCVRVSLCVLCQGLCVCGVKVCVCVLLRGVERCLFVCSLCLNPKPQPTMDACRCLWSSWRG